MNVKRVTIIVLIITAVAFVVGGYVDEPRTLTYLERLAVGLIAALAFLLSFHGPEVVALFKRNSK